jgi:hypothetical protein
MTGSDSVVCTSLTKLCENQHFSLDPLDRLANDVYDYVTNGRVRPIQRATDGERVSLVHKAEVRCTRAGFSFIRYR